MRRTFDDLTGPLSLDLRVPAGSVAVDAVETSQLEVELEPLNDAARDALEAVVVELRHRGEGQELVVHVPERRGLGFFGRGPEFGLLVRCPEGASVRSTSASADFEGRGMLGSLEVKAASGDVAADRVSGEAKVQTASGDVELGTVAGRTIIQTASGDVAVERAEQAVRAQLVSGDLVIRDALDSIDATTVSGDQRLEAVSAGSITLQSVSGDINVGVRPGRNVWMDVRSLSGDTSSRLTATDEPSGGDEPVVELRIKSVSGDVEIESAAAAPLER
jgi:Putative adhesin